jgi:hypothetical protein
MKNKRIAVGVVVGVLLAAPSSAFIVVDYGVLFETELLGKLRERVLDIVTDQNHIVRRMARSLWVFTDLSRYVPRNAPLWRTRQAPSTVPGVSAYMDSLNGVGSDATDAITVAMEDPERALLMLDVKRAEALRLKLAQAELDQSVFALGTSTTGRERGRRKIEKADLEEFERDVLDGSLGTSALAGVLVSGDVLARRQAATQIKMQISLLEQRLARNKANRDREVEAANQWIRRPQRNEGDAGLATGATEALKTWRLP